MVSVNAERKRGDCRDRRLEGRKPCIRTTFVNAFGSAIRAGLRFQGVPYPGIEAATAHLDMRRPPRRMAPHVDTTARPHRTDRPR